MKKACYILGILALLTGVMIRFTPYPEQGIIGNMTRPLIKQITNVLPVKVICDEEGKPFLFRYHLFALTPDGPGMAIHHFVDSDPDRGYHDHPWTHSCSLILAGGYEERLDPNHPDDKGRWINAGQLNYIHGERTRHRVMLPDGGDAWTLFFFCKREKVWGFYNVVDDQLKYKPMAKNVKDQDGGWWHTAPKGKEVLKLWKHLCGAT